MTDWRMVADEELARGLEDLGGMLAYPAEPDVAATVRARLEAAGAPAASTRGWRRAWRFPTWRVAAAVLALVLSLTAVLAASPRARHAVAGWLGLRGVSIEYRESPDQPPVGSGLSLGERVAESDAVGRVSFPVLVPPPERFGPPAEVYYSPSPPGGRVTLLYRPTSELPAVRGPNTAAAGLRGPNAAIGLLVTEFRADVEQASVRKLVGSGVHLEEVTVAGGRGYWFEGEPHRLFFADENGQFFEDRSRLAGNTLVWEQGDLTLRLESGLPRDDSIRLAELLRPRR